MNPENQLAESISNLACAIRESTEARKNGETKAILEKIAEMEKRLLTAIGGASDATLKRLTKELKGPTDSLEAAVKENQPAK